MSVLENESRRPEDVVAGRAAEEGEPDRTLVDAAAEIRRPAWLRRHATLLAVLLVALVARCWDVMAQLPAVYHPDEPLNISLIERMVDTGTLDPHFFHYPSLFFYLQAAVSPDGPFLGWLLPGSHAPLRTLAMGTSYAPSLLIVLTHRALTVAFGVALVGVVWVLTKRTFGGTVAPFVAAGLTALSPNLIEHSEYVTPDMLAVLTIAVAVLAAVHVFQTGSTRAHVVAGLCVGLAVSAKYNAALVAAAVVIAALARIRRPGWSAGPALGRLALSGVAAVAAFCLTTPFALVDRAQFVADVTFERAHYATGHAGMQGHTPQFYLSLLFGEEWPISVLGVIGIAAVFLRARSYRRLAAVLLAFPVVYCLFVFRLPVRNDRTILLILPLLAVFAGFAARWVRDDVLARLGRPSPRAAGLVLAGLLAIGVGIGVPTAVRPSAANDAQVAAGRWLAANVPHGTHIFIESYSPWIDPQDYHVVQAASLITSLVPAGTRYVIASRVMYGRYVEHPDVFPAQAKAYRALFRSLQEVREFSAGDSTIRIYEVPAH